MSSKKDLPGIDSFEELMILMSKAEPSMDKDLYFLKNCSVEELSVLVKIMTDKFSCSLSEDAIIYPSNHVAEIANEFCLFGGNTIANIFRFGEGPSYRKILTNVCKDLKVPFNKNHSIEHIEKNLLETVLENAWEKMSEEQKKEFLGAAGYKGNIDINGVTGLGLTQIAKMFGFKLYQGATILVSSIAGQFGVTLPMVFYTTMTTFLKGFLGILGPIMWAWMVVDIASPSKKVIVPGCIYIAALRAVYNKTE